MPDKQPVTAKQGLHTYSLWFNGDSDEHIREWFKKIHGYYPDTIIKTGGGKLAGPLKEDKNANT